MYACATFLMKSALPGSQQIESRLLSPNLGEEFEDDEATDVREGRYYQDMKEV